MADKELESIGEVGRMVAATVAAARKQKDMSLAELARRTNGKLNELALRRIERLGRRIDVDDLFVLAQALDIEPEDLLNGDFGGPSNTKEAWELIQRAGRVNDDNRKMIDRAIEMLEREADD